MITLKLIILFGAVICTIATPTFFYRNDNTGRQTNPMQSFTDEIPTISLKFRSETHPMRYFLMAPWIGLINGVGRMVRNQMGMSEAEHVNYIDDF